MNEINIESRDRYYKELTIRLTEVYRSIHETLENTYPITAEREKLLQAAAEQIERTVPDLEQIQIGGVTASD